MKDKEFEHIAPVLRRRSVATARSLGLDADDAEDVAQDALLKLWSLRGECICVRWNARPTSR